MIVYPYHASIGKDALPPFHIVVSNGKLIALDWFDDNQSSLSKLINHAKSLEKVENLAQKNLLYQQNCEVLFNVKNQLREYFLGKRQCFDIELDLSIGTPFQQKVWQALLQIEYGETISYKTLASRIGQPTAYRAVANANGKNPISIIIACHRVIASDGGLGGYSGGIGIKRQLLALEGVLL